MSQKLNFVGTFPMQSIMRDSLLVHVTYSKYLVFEMRCLVVKTRIYSHIQTLVDRTYESYSEQFFFSFRANGGFNNPAFHNDIYLVKHHIQHKCLV